MAAATQLMQRIEGEDLPAPEQSQGGFDEYDGPEGFEIVIIVAILFGFAFLVRPVPAAAAVGIFIFTIFEALRSEEHTSELQSRSHLICRLLLKKIKGRHESSMNRRRI